jgi:hypothetical protein
MTKTALVGPLVAYGSRNTPGSGANQSGAGNNPDKAPSLFDLGLGILDGRAGYNQTRAGAIGWYGFGDCVVLDYVPSALSTTSMAAAQVPTAGTALTLVTATGAGITVLASALTVWSSGNVVPAGALAIDGPPTLIAAIDSLPNLATGNATLMFYSPATTAARNVQIASAGNDSAATFTVAGYDVYGFPMHEAITGANVGTAQGKKAFKFVVSITPSGTLSGSNVSAGQGDKYGFNLKATNVGYTSIWWNGVQAANTTTPFGTASAYTFADTTNPATSTTGDVRGTIYVGTATPSNGTDRLTIIIAPSMISLSGTYGLYGVTQF